MYSNSSNHGGGSLYGFGMDERFNPDHMMPLNELGDALDDAIGVYVTDSGPFYHQLESCKALAAELAALRAHLGDPGPKVRLWRGEITHEDYRAIQERKRELADALRPARLAADRAAALSRELEAELGRALSSDEKRVFLETVEDAAPTTNHQPLTTNH